MNEITARVREALSALGADYDIIDIDPDLADTAEFCAEYGYRLDQSANAILIASKRPIGQHALCLALATTRLDVNHRVKAAMGVKKLSFAPEEQTTELTGMMLGGVTPFGVPPDLPVLVDGAVIQCERVIVGGGDRATKVFVDPEVFGRMPATRVVEGLAQPIEG